MPLYIKDDAIDRLARRYQALTKAPSKTEAVRKALQLALDTELAKPVLEDIAVAFCRNLRTKATVRNTDAEPR
ncbi:type II toxin-antitoxin system VapB family antitoxin [Rhizobium tumorigenes]|uniref:Type II toxin-antitoxin system VapB family antitoxin n=1 Tax=Rhizobium tumorigenes TaxID=2041385 RepID=A0AAF1K9U9_9HYPH|nr:type II toxin-antitoxin system VapB family antitoxin [Rhizobium tumorigenes]WFR98992.1 type II toxin-antitoxin system VapB family antitoxin [Rhizobium tumorigenes]